MNDYTVPCHRTGVMSGLNDGAFRLTLAQPADITLAASASEGSPYVMLVRGSCDPSATILQCSTATTGIGTSLNLVQRNLAAGTYWVIVETNTPSATASVTVTATISAPPAPRPLGEACPEQLADPAIDINDGAPHVVALRTYENDYTLSCNANASGAATRDAVVRLALANPSDVRIVGTAPSGATVLSLRSESCPDQTSEIRCATPASSSGGTGSAIINAAALPAGTYWVVVENTDATNPNVVVTAEIRSPPAAPASNDVCVSGIVVDDLADGLPRVARLNRLTDDYTLGCRASATPNNAQDAVYGLVLTAESDVEVHAAKASTSGGATYVSLRRSDCTDTSPELRCVSGSTEAVASVRNLSPGTYWVVVENTGTIADDVVVSAIVTSSTVRDAADVCPGVPVTIDAGPTSIARASLSVGSDIGTACGTSSNYYATWADGIASFALPTARDVVISAWPTRTGQASVYAALQVFSTCDGTRSSPAGVCSLSTSSSSDVTPTTQILRGLDAGTYYAMVDASAAQVITNFNVNVATLAPGGAAGSYAMSSPSGVSFVDACALPGAVTVLPSTDSGTASISRAAIPFDVKFYNLDLSAPAIPSFTVSADGWLSLMPATQVNAVSAFGVVPAPSLYIAPFSRNIRTGVGGICYAVEGTAPNRRFIVEWNDATATGTPAPHMTFEVLVNEAPAGTNNTIDVVYQTMTNAATTAVVGVDNEDGTIFTSDPGPFTAGRIVRYTHAP